MSYVNDPYPFLPVLDLMVPYLLVAVQKYFPLSVSWFGLLMMSWPPLMVTRGSPRGSTSSSTRTSFLYASLYHLILKEETWKISIHGMYVLQ